MLSQRPSLIIGQLIENVVEAYLIVETENGILNDYFGKSFLCSGLRISLIFLMSSISFILPPIHNSEEEVEAAALLLHRDVLCSQ